MSSQTFSTFSEVGMIDARLRSGTITLPLTRAIPYRILTMKDIYGATGLSTTTIQTTAPDVFEDGTSTRILNTAYQSLTVYAGQPGKWMLTATSLSNATTIGTLNISTLSVSSVTNFMNASQITSTVQGLGSAGYVSSQQLLSTSAGLVNPGQLTSTIQGLGTAGYASTSYIGAGLSTMSTNLARNQFINQLAASTFIVSSVIGNNAYFSTLTVDNLNIGQAAGYIALGDIIVNSASTINQYAGTTYNTISYTSTANVSSLNVYQVNAQNMIGLLSTVNLTSTVQGLGSAGYVSSTQLLSTSLGIRNFMEAFIDPTELTSTVIGLGTGGFVSTLGLTYSLASTVTGLGTLGYVSTSQLLSTTVGVYQAITAATNVITGTNLTSTVAGLGSAGYVSTTQLLSTSAGLVNPGQLISTVQGLGTAGYASTSYVGSALSSFSTNLSRGFFTSTFATSSINANTGFISSLTVNALYIGSNTGFTNLGDVLTTSVSTLVLYTGQGYAINTFTSSLNTSSLVSFSNTMTIVSSQQLNVSSINGVVPWQPSYLTSTVAGLGQAGYVSSSQLLSTSAGLVNPLQLTSTVAGLGSAGYVSTTQLLSTSAGLINPQQLTSTVTGLGQSGYVSSTQLLSTSFGLKLYIDSFIDPTELTSTVIGLGTGGFVSTLGLTYSLASTVTGLGTLGYVSTSQLLSTTVGTYQAITAATNVITGTNLTSTVAGLGSAGYVSTANLAGHVSTANLAGLVSTTYLTTQLASTVQGLGTAGYVSTANLAGHVSTANLAGLVSTTYLTTQLASTVQGLGTAGYVSTTQLLSTSAGLASLTQTQLASTVQGLGSAGYISSSQLLSTVVGLSGNSGPTQAQVTSSINNLLVPYSTLNTSTYFQVKASTNQLFFGNYFPPDSGSGPSAQLFIGDIKANIGNATTIEPIVLINQPIVSPYVPTTNVTYPSIGSVSSFTVPAGITSITVTLGGARGAGGYYNYPGNSGFGWGDTVSGTLAVTPGETLTIIVGSVGAYAYEASAGTSAFGGGGIGGAQTNSTYGGGGGGRTAIQRGRVDIVTAGGGGGGQGGTGGYNGGNAGYDTGYQGGGGSQTTAATSSMGGGGSQTTGGASPGSPATSGSARTGGNSAGQGGGGGGGYYGGGGGYNGCGGGGSSYIANLTGTVTYNVNNTVSSGGGILSITYGQSLVYRNANMLELRGYTGTKTIFDANMNLGINISSINTSYALDVGGAARTESLLVSSIVAISSLTTTSLITTSLNTGTMTMSNLFLSYSTLNPTSYFTLSTTNTQLLLGTAGSNSQVYVGDIRSYFGDATSTNPIFTIQQTPLVTSASSNTVTYSYTGSNQSFTVPNGITSIFITLSGAAGQSSLYSVGGNGGYVSGTLAVSSGGTYTVVVGGTNAGNAGAYGGGGEGGSTGGSSGGGRSAINFSGVDLATAGGGGGAAATNNGGPVGGAGGGTTGGSGTSPALAGQAGTGGTQSTGGTGVYNNGTQYSGGAGDGSYSAGGGGGWWGGGGAGSTGLGGAGGGSSYVANLTGTVVNTQGGGATAGNYSTTGSQPGTVTVTYFTGIAPRNANLFEVVAYNGNKFIVDSNANVGINLSTTVSSFTLDVNGPFRSAVYYSTITAGGTMTITPGDNFGVYYNITASGTYTISLASTQPSQNIGKYYVFRNNSGSSLSITITGGSGITSPITVATATTATIMVATTSTYALF